MRSFNQTWVKTKTSRWTSPKCFQFISQIKFCHFATASFNRGQLQAVLFKDGLYRKTPLKF